MMMKQIFIAFFLLVFQNLMGLKILFFDHTFPSITQTFVLNQITGMIDRGHEVTILALGRDGNIARAGKGPGLHPDIEKYALLDKVYYKQLPPDKRDYDIVLCEFGHLGNMFLRLNKQYNIKGKIVTFFRGRDLNALPRGNKNYYKGLFKAGDYFLPVCEYFRKKLIKLGCDDRKIFVLHSTIDTNKFCFRERKLEKNSPVKLIVTNRLVEKKGTEYSIKAVAKLIKKYPQIDFTIIGGGPLEGRLKKIIQEFGVEDNIHLVGWKSQEEVKGLLDESHIFVLPSVTGKDRDKEGIPNAIKEAMAMGLPVVSTYHSGIPEIVKNRRTGFLVPEKNIPRLMSRLEYLIVHPEIWQSMGRCGRHIIESEFDKDRVNDQLHELCLRFALKSRLGADMQENYYSDVVIFSEDNPLLLKEFLELVNNHVIGNNEIFILYKTTNSGHIIGYQNLRERYEKEGYRFIEYSGSNLSKVLSDVLVGTSSPYVFFVSAQHKITSTIDFQQAIHHMENTDAYGCYFAYDKKQALLDKVPYYKLESNLYGWQFDCAKKGWQLPHNIHGSLYRKENFMKCVGHNCRNLGELKKSWREAMINSGNIGLFYETASLIIR